MTGAPARFSFVTTLVLPGAASRTGSGRRSPSPGTIGRSAHAVRAAGRCNCNTGKIPTGRRSCTTTTSRHWPTVARPAPLLCHCGPLHADARAQAAAEEGGGSGGGGTTRTVRDTQLRARPRPVACRLPLAPSARQARTMAYAAGRSPLALCLPCAVVGDGAELRARPVAGPDEAWLAAGDGQRQGGDRWRGAERAARSWRTTPLCRIPRTRMEKWSVSVTEGRLLAMLQGVDSLSLAQINEATQAWVQKDYNNRLHREIGATPTARFLESPRRECPSGETLRRAFRTGATRRQRHTDGTLSLGGVRCAVAVSPHAASPPPLRILGSVDDCPRRPRPRNLAVRALSARQERQRGRRTPTGEASRDRCHAGDGSAAAQATPGGCDRPAPCLPSDQRGR